MSPAIGKRGAVSSHAKATRMAPPPPEPDQEYGSDMESMSHDDPDAEVETQFNSEDIRQEYDETIEFFINGHANKLRKEAATFEKKAKDQLERTERAARDTVAESSRKSRTRLEAIFTLLKDSGDPQEHAINALSEQLHSARKEILSESGICAALEQAVADMHAQEGASSRLEEPSPTAIYAARVKNVPRERRKLIKQYKAVAKEREQYKQASIDAQALLSHYKSILRA